MPVTFPMMPFTHLPVRFMCIISMSLLSGCQLVKLQENQLSASLNNKTDSILTHQKLSTFSHQILLMVNESDQSCLNALESCIHKMRNNETLDIAQVYAAASELYMARALSADQNPQCKKA
ncbi:hypothetical protein [Acinetobacter sp. YH12073]|uniref:hypothetical protein n=1 Tax=Acinetobacter sp. YH12073 TaxID=2601069 RepID=UPI0015D3C0E1|nr:hypothetical protein [Acinetobacter sp. YH12073]